METSELEHGRFQRVDWVESTGSTNADLAERVRDGDHEPAVLLTDEQTAGRGRRDRSWEMPAGGGLLMSLHVPWPNEDVGIVASALGVAAVDAIGDIDVSANLKWPNDILLADGRKVAGLLGERVETKGHVGVVIGMGLNVSWPTRDAGLPTAGCLDEVAPEPIDRAALANSIIARFGDELTKVEQFGASIVIERYRARSGTLGQQVRVTTPTGDILGRAIDVDIDGRLLVETDGGMRTIDVGDVVHLRSK